MRKTKYLPLEGTLHADKEIGTYVCGCERARGHIMWFCRENFRYGYLVWLSYLVIPKSEKCRLFANTR